jgi:hypothetical protein
MKQIIFYQSQGWIQSWGTVGQAISRGHLLGMKLN